MPSLTSDALTSDIGGLAFLADVIGTVPGERSGDEFQMSFDPARFPNAAQDSSGADPALRPTRIFDEVA